MKIMMAIPSSELVLKSTAINFTAVAIQLYKAGHEVILIDGASSLPSMTVNSMIEALLGSPADALMLIDCDQIVPMDAGVRLAAHNLPIVLATYRARKPPHTFLGAHVDRSPITGAEIGLLPLSFGPTGCALLRRDALETIGWPWFHERYGEQRGIMAGPDGGFCLMANEKGIPVMCDFDMSREVIHLGLHRIGWGGPESNFSDGTTRNLNVGPL